MQKIQNNHPISRSTSSSSLTPFKSPLITLIKKVVLIPFCHPLSHLHDFCCLGCEHPKGTKVCLHTTCNLRIIFTLLVKTWVSLCFLQLQDSILWVWLGPLLQLKKLLTNGVPIPHNHSYYSPTWLIFSFFWLFSSHSLNPLSWKSHSVSANTIMQGSTKWAVSETGGRSDVLRKHRRIIYWGWSWRVSQRW